MDAEVDDDLENWREEALWAHFGSHSLGRASGQLEHCLTGEDGAFAGIVHGWVLGSCGILQWSIDCCTWLWDAGFVQLCFESLSVAKYFFRKADQTASFSEHGCG